MPRAKTEPNLRPLNKSEVWLWHKVEVRATQQPAEKQAKSVRAFATMLARKRSCTVSEGIKLVQQHASERY